MEVTTVLIRRFLENKCSKDEAEIVSRYLADNPAVLDQFLPEQEWEAFQALHAVPARSAEEWFQKIQAQKEETIKMPFRWPWRRLAAAVILLAGAITAYQLFFSPAQAPIARAEHKPQPAQAAKTEKRVVNNTARSITHILEDQSRIELTPNSEISYPQPLHSNRRDIRLQGEATFYVTKDKKRPFTVFTDQFSTTALGTVFRIKAPRNNHLSSVKLISGKVVVKDLGHGSAPLYLEPGDECRFNNQDKRLVLNAATTATARAASKVVPAAVPPANSNEIIFSNSPLTEVVNKISELYKVTIRTDQIQLAGRTFTGTFTKDQPIADVLATIAGLNNFVVVRDSTAYRLTTP